MALLGLAGGVRADFVLDWGVTSPTTWSDTTGPTFTESFDIDPGYAGNELTVTITDSNNRMLATYPQINSVLTGGKGASDKSLQIDLNNSNTSQFVTVTVSFDTSWAPYGVDIAEITLFDVDRGIPFTFGGKDYVVYRDEIRNIQALDMSSNAVYATSVTGSASNVVTGSSSTYAVNGINGVTNGDYAEGNVVISFGTNTIRQFSFDYGNGSGTPIVFPNPGEQTIGIWNITGRRVPEYHPALASMLMCGLLSAWRCVRRKCSPS